MKHFFMDGVETETIKATTKAVGLSKKHLNRIVMLSSAKHLAEPWPSWGWAQIIRLRRAPLMMTR